MSRFSNNSFGKLFVLFVSLFQFYHCLLLDDFRSSDTSNWRELSDAIGHHGQSIASFVTHPLKECQNAVLFTLLAPCENNAAFAGILKRVSLDISNKSSIVLKARNQGNFTGYEFILRHHNDFGDEVPSYVTYFEVPDSQSFAEITLPIDDFRAYQRGHLILDAKPLDKTHVTSVGILAYGGLYRAQKQRGVAVLEIEWIRID